MNQNKNRRRLISNISKIIQPQQQSKMRHIKNTRHFRMKSQPTSDSIAPHSYRYNKADTIDSQESRTRIQALPTMNDDFRQRKVFYKESFIIKKHRIIKLQYSESLKFCYVTLYDTKCDLHYKLRLLKQTGKYMLENIQVSKQHFRDYIFRDEKGNYHIHIAFMKMDRKFKFQKYQPSIFLEQSEQFDDYLKLQIFRLDRTELLLNNHFKP